MDFEINVFSDLCPHLDELNPDFQGRNKAIITMYDLIKAFEAKLQVFYRNANLKTFNYFKNTQKYFLEF